MKYGKIQENSLIYPQALEFKGIPNWEENDPLLRRKGYMPIPNWPQEIDDKEIVVDTFETVPSSMIKIEPRPVVIEDYDEQGQKIGQHTEWRDQEIQYDASFISILSSHYEDLPPIPQKIVVSKGAFIEALMGVGLYDAVKAIYEKDTDLQIFFAGFKDIDLNYPATQAIIQRYPEVFTEENIQKIINAIMSIA